MQILSNALPGFRDLRGPVIAGYTWLLFVWIAASPDLNTRPHSRVGGSVWDLGHHIGRAGVGIAVSIAAYLIGSVSQELSDRVAEIVRRFTPRSLGYASPISFAGASFDRFSEPVRDVRDRAVASARELNLRDPLAAEVAEAIEERAREAEFEARRELDLPATLLVGDRPELFAEVDRLRAEGELRITVAPPLLALAVLLGVLQTPLWVFAVIPIGVLFAQGVARQGDSQKIIRDAIAFGRIASPSLTRFIAWVDALPQRVRNRAAA